MAAQDLTTVEDVRRFMQKLDADSDQDALIQSLITAASVAIMEHCQRQFVPADTAAAKTFAYYGGRSIDLAPYDLRTASSVVLDSQSSSLQRTLVATTDYTLRPKPARNGVYQWLRLINYAAIQDDLTGREITITGNWGFSSIPEDIVHWTNITVVTWMRRDVSVFERTFDLAEDRVERPQELPSAVRHGLGHYKRVALP